MIASRSRLFALLECLFFVAAVAFAGGCARVNHTEVPAVTRPLALQIRIFTSGPVDPETFYYIAMDQTGNQLVGPKPFLSGADVAENWTNYILLYRNYFYFGNTGWKPPANTENYIDDVPRFLSDYPNMLDTASVIPPREILIRLKVDGVPNTNGRIGLNFITSDQRATSLNSDVVGVDALSNFFTIQLTEGQYISSQTYSEPPYDVDLGLHPRLDTDNDQFPDDMERALGSLPDNSLSTPMDSDSDGYPDEIENYYGTNPFLSTSFPPQPLDKLWDSRDMISWEVKVER